jgi:hypothetical protein
MNQPDHPTSLRAFETHRGKQEDLIAMEANVSGLNVGAKRAAAARASRRQRLERIALLKQSEVATKGPKEIATFNGRAALRVTEFCQAFGISKSKGYAMIKAGQLPTVNVAGLQLVPVHALAAAKARGQTLGNPRLAEARSAGHAAAMAGADAHAAAVLPAIRAAQAAGAKTLREIAAALDGRGITTARGGKWDATTVRKILRRVRTAEGHSE